MRRLLITAAVYGGLGLAGGLYYRTLTHARHFQGDTQLAVVHTHLLALGMLTFLVLAALERSIGFLGTRAGRFVEPAWHVGMALTVGGMLAGGTLTVLGVAFPAAAVAGVSGLGHMVMTSAIVALFMALLRAESRRPDALPA